MSIKTVLLVILSAVLATNYFYDAVLTPDKSIRFPEIVQQHGYTGEEHEVITEDGYIISIFRIRREKCKRLRTPVIILHGLLQSSDSWLDPGVNLSLPYLLSDECHDVWVGNTRGNYYGRRHISLDPDVDDKFWQFSADEIAYYDIPAMIDSVLNVTRAQTLNYIGFSQGGGSFYMMCSERPEYNAKVHSMVALASPTTLKTSNGPFQNILNTAMKVETLFSKMGINEVFSRNMMTHKLLNLLCSVTKRGCYALLESLDGYNPTSFNDNNIIAIVKHIPDGTSIKTLARYGQASKFGKFQKFDFGEVENMKKYGLKEPPLYDLQKVTVPILLVHGRNDLFVNITDIEWLSTKLPNLKELFIVDDPKWNHFDMVYNQNLKHLVFPKINEYLLR